jgi:putative transposase
MLRFVVWQWYRVRTVEFVWSLLITITLYDVIIIQWAGPSLIFSFMRSFPPKIGGVEDHVHVFSSLSKNIAFSDLIGRLKGASSRRLKEKGFHGFGWQNGYGAFSVSESNVEAVTAYILNQAEHHKKFSYQEEIREIFKRHRVAFDERYVWD